jgi:hypothetical protein
MTNEKTATPTTEVVCPDCGAAMQATVKLDCDVDPKTGAVTHAATGGSVEFYCSDDCGWTADGGDISVDVDVTLFIDPVTADDFEPSDTEIGRNEPQ